MLSLTGEFRFEAAHHLALAHLSPEENQKIYGPCSGPHGHSYRLQVTICGTANAYGWLLDFGELREVVWRHVLSAYDHANLNVLEDFREMPPTAENMAQAIFYRLRPNLQGENYHLFKIAVFETSDLWATWEEKNAPGA